MFVITIWLTVTKYPYLKWQWMLSVLPRFCITSITVKIFIGLDWVAQSVRYKKGRLFTLHEHMGSPPPQFLMGYVRIAHLFLFLNCLSMFSVYLEFTSSPILMGSVLLIFLVCSWLVHQCCLFLLSSRFLVRSVLLILLAFCVFWVVFVFVLSCVCPMLAVSMCCPVMSHPLTSSSWILCVQCWQCLCVVQ
jgi:hypothetical protein